MDTINHRLEEDLGPLAWVLGEVRNTWTQAIGALREFQRQASDPSHAENHADASGSLRLAQNRFHQVCGALEMVGAFTPAFILRNAETAVSRFIAKPDLCTAAAIDALEQAGQAVAEYLESLLQGENTSALVLFLPYRSIHALAGAAYPAGPADLWHLEGSLSEPVVPLPAKAIVPSNRVRGLLDQAILKIIRDTKANAAANDLVKLCLGLATGNPDFHERTFWKVAAGFFEALAIDAVPNDIYVKRAATRVLVQYASLIEGNVQITARWMQHLLFFCAQAQPGDGEHAPVLQAVRQAFGLTGHRAVDYNKPYFWHIPPQEKQALEQLLKDIAESWSLLAENNPAQLGQARTLFAKLDQSLPRHIPGSQGLTTALLRTADTLHASGQIPATELAMEVATSVLYLQAMLSSLGLRHADIDQRMERLRQRLEAVGQTGHGEAIEPWMEDLYSKVSDTLTMGNVVGELRASLAEVESSIDTFFRQPEDSAKLHSVPGSLNKIKGVLSILGLDQATLAVERIAHYVQAFITHDGSEDDSQPLHKDDPRFEKVGNNLGVLGLQMDMLAYQPTLAKTLFVYDAAEETLKPLMGRLKTYEIGDRDIFALVKESQPLDARGIQVDETYSDAIAEEPVPAVATTTDSHAQPSLPDEKPQQDATEPAHEVAAAAPVVPAPAPVSAIIEPAGDDDDDGDLLDIFLAEAQDVIDSAQAALAELEQRPSDTAQQTILRRALHTLKGSSRMVGLDEFGEAAWSFEQLLNAWLAEQKPFNTSIQTLSTQALTALDGWVTDIHLQDHSHWSATPFRRSADALRLEGNYIPLSSAPGTTTLSLDAAPAPATADAQDSAAVEHAAGHSSAFADDEGGEAGLTEISSLLHELDYSVAQSEEQADRWGIEFSPTVIKEGAEKGQETPPATQITVDFSFDDALADTLNTLGQKAETAEARHDEDTAAEQGIFQPADATATETPAPLLSALEDIDLTPVLSGDAAGPADQELEALPAGEIQEEDQEPALQTPQLLEHFDATATPAPLSPVLETDLDPAFGEEAVPPADQELEALPAGEIQEKDQEPALQTPQFLEHSDVSEPEQELTASAVPLEENSFAAPPEHGTEAETHAEDLGDAAPAGLPSGPVASEQPTADSPSKDEQILVAWERAQSLAAGLASWAQAPAAQIPYDVVAQSQFLVETLENLVLDSSLSEFLSQFEYALQHLLTLPVALAHTQADKLTQATTEIHQALETVVANSGTGAISSQAHENLQEILQTSATGEQDDLPETPGQGSVDAALEDADSAATQADDNAIIDHVDADLFPIFEEEAIDLLPRLVGALRHWAEKPAQSDARREALRVLHTLKGSSRLAGAMQLGEMAHEFESAIEALEPGAFDAATAERLLTRYDELQAAFDTLRSRTNEALAGGLLTSPQPSQSSLFVRPTPTPQPAQKAAAPDKPATAEHAHVADLQAQTDQTALTAVAVEESGPASPLPGPTPLDVKPSPASRQTLRVRSQLINRLINQSGEIQISRIRAESRLKQLNASLKDMTGNLERLRSQLRELEVQAESQMQSRLTLGREHAQFDPLEFDRFTRVQELTRMMAETVNDVATVQRSLQVAMSGTEDDLVEQERKGRELQRDLLRTRMVEFDSITERFYVLVRQAAAETGKHVQLIIHGGSIEVDRSLLDRMLPSFEHLLRNCVSHGIELPVARQQAGKPETGVITITVSQEGNDVTFLFNDDGKGLDLQAIRQRGIEHGLIESGQELSDTELANLIFLPGFTTMQEVTGLAGRGIGMDVVRTELNGLGGHIKTSTTPGKGSTFQLVMPLTTAVTQVLLVRIGSVTVAIPANQIDNIHRLTIDQLEAAYAAQTLLESGERQPFYWAGALLQYSTRSAETEERTKPVVLVRIAAQTLALHVDEILGNQEVVIKNLGPQIASVPGLAGMSVLASGAVLLIYNFIALASTHGSAAHALQARHLREPVEAAVSSGAESPVLEQSVFAHTATTHLPLVLVVDDSITVRRVTQRMLKREGYRVELAADGVQAMQKLEQERPAVVLSDIEMPRMDGFELLRHIREQSQFADLPVIMITSRTAQKHKDHALELGASHFLGKPYSENELLDLVKQYAQAFQSSAQPG